MSPILLAVVGISLFAAIGAGGAASWWLARTSTEQRRIRSVTAGASTGLVKGGAAVSLVDPDIDPILARLSALAPRSAKDMGRLQRRLARAGYPHQNAGVFFSLAQVLLPVVVGGVTVFALGPGNWLYALFAAAIGYVLPGQIVDRQTLKRQKAIQNGLADALDLLTICVEAGSGLDLAIARASEELMLAHPDLASELRLIVTETRAGKPRIDAFKNFERRTGVEDVRSLVNMLTQTDRFGTSIGQALRSHADTMRTKRRQRAEERAGKVGVKLVFPLALCLFPALYIVCFGSIVIQIYKAFF